MRKRVRINVNQQTAFELNLSMNDLAVATWFRQYFNTHGTDYKSIQYQKILDDLPTLRMKKQSLQKFPIKRLVDAGVLKHLTVRDGGTFAMFAPGENFDRLFELRKEG